MTDTGSSFYENGALNGGVINCQTCTLSLSQDVFYNNYAVEGGVFLMTDSVSLTAD